MIRRAVAITLVAAAALTAQAVGLAAQEDEELDSPTPPEISLVAQTPWVAPNGDFTMRVRLPESIPDTAQVSVTVFDAVGSRSEFVGQLLGNDFGDDIQEVALPMPFLATRPDGSVDLVVRTATSTTEGRARLPEAGVYPVVVRVLDQDDTETASMVTHLLRLPEEQPPAPLRLAVVAPLHAPLGIQPGGDIRFSDADIQRLAEVGNTLADQPSVPLTMAPTPETVESLASLGTDDGARLVSTLEQAAGGRQLLSGSYVPIDEAAWVAEDIQEDFRAQLAGGESALATLLEARPDRRTWVGAATLTPDAVRVLRESGVDQLVLPEEAMTPLDTDTFPTTLAQPFQVEASDGAPIRTVAVDPGLAGEVGSTGDPVLDAHRVLADLSVVYFDRPGSERGVVLSPPLDAEVPGAFYAALLSALDEPGLVSPVTVDDLFASVPEALDGGEDGDPAVPLVRSLAPGELPDLGNYPSRLTLTNLGVQGFAAMTGTDHPQLPGMRSQLLASGARELNQDGRGEYLQAVNDDVRVVTGGVGAPPRQTVTLTSRDGEIPLRLQNDTGRPVDVLLTFESDKLEFPDGSRLRLTLEEGSTPVNVRVRSRASGAFPLDVTVTSPDGILTLARSRVTVRSTAVSGVGIAIGTAAGLVLLVWWVRHHRALRRQRRLVPAEAG